jgi:hypothetical protein
MNQDYRNAAELLERRGLAVIDRSNQQHWTVQLTRLGERMARRLIERDPDTARVFEALGAKVRLDDAREAR